jgi:hypothetical protein
LPNVIGNQPDDDKTDNLERDYSHIDTKKSILTGSLRFKDSFLNIANALIIILFFSFLVGIFIFSINRQLHDKTVSVDYTYLILKIIAIIIFSYVVFRKLTEKKLFKIKTNLPKDKSRQLIDDYFTRLKYRSWNSSKDMASYSDSSTFIGTYNYFIIPLDNEVLFTVIKDQNRLPLPAIITLWTTRSDLKRVLSRCKLPQN